MSLESTHREPNSMSDLKKAGIYLHMRGESISETVRIFLSNIALTAVSIWSRGQISNFEFCCTPQEEKVGYYFQSGTCLGASETHVLLSFLWSIFCKWPEINVTLQTLKIAEHKIQD